MKKYQKQWKKKREREQSMERRKQTPLFLQ
jgi:hypothetical protein